MCVCVCVCVCTYLTEVTTERVMIYTKISHVTIKVSQMY